MICEGRHDVIFVQRSLGALAGCEWFGGAIRELPSPFGALQQRSRAGLVATRMARDAESLTFREAAYPALPHFESALVDEARETLFMQLIAGGDGQAGAVADVLKDLDESLDVGPVDVTEYAVAFVFDADSDGVERRLSAFRSAYRAHFGSLAAADHARWLRAATCPVGVFVVHRSPEDPFGTLEDHLAPMAAATWPRHYDGACTFIDGNMGDGDAASKSASARLKAVITSAAQFEHPGAPLSTVVARDGIPSEQFEQCKLSQDLVDFLLAVPWLDDEPLSVGEAR